MNGAISKYGYLKIERTGKMALQLCPLREGTPCGDWCPLFGEPDYGLGSGQSWTPCRIAICQGRVLHLHHFADERRQA